MNLIWNRKKNKVEEIPATNTRSETEIDYAKALAWLVMQDHGGTLTMELPTDPAFGYYIMKNFDGTLYIRSGIAQR